MKVIKRWKIDSIVIEILHETGNPLEKGRWEFRVNDEVKMYGEGTHRHATEAVYTRRKLSW